ncbi:MAG TPA: M28 family peptidase [Vicinamibacterales bacterium]|nr:M28 family peptidase [Vicinamibacterales bacterium]
MTRRSQIALTATLTAAIVGAAFRQGQAQDQAPAAQAGGRGGGAGQGQAQAAGGGGRGAYEPTLWLPDDQFLRWPFTDLPYAKIDGFKIKEYINQITAISRKSRDDGNQYWGRIAGTPYDQMTTDWVIAQYRRLGLEQVRKHEFTLPPQWFPTSWEVSVSGNGTTVPIKTAFPLYASVGTPDGKPVSWEPVWVGTGMEADFLGRDVRGKAVIVYGFPDPGGRENTATTFGAVARADRLGAAAVFEILGIPGNVTNEPAGGATMAPAKIPVFVVGNQDGAAIRDMIEKGYAPRITTRLQIDMRTGLKSAEVFGVLPGMTDEQVAVMAHTDSFFEGAMDNASGVATNVALAEYYAGIPKKNRHRTMTFFTTSAHHSPSGNDGGIRWVAANMKDMLAKTAVLVNCEHTAQTATFVIGGSFVASNTVSARRWFVGGSDQLKAIVTKAFHDYGIALYSRPEPRPGGELGPMSTEAPSFHIIDHTVYHTDLDTLNAVPAYGLEQSARAFAKIIDEVNKLPLTQLRVNIPTAPTTTGSQNRRN